MADGVETATRTRAPLLEREIALPRVTAAQIALAVILLAAFITRFGRLATPGEFYFDEVYFAKNGQEIYRGEPSAWEFYGHENTHPPFSKLLMAGGIAIVGAADEVAPPLVPGEGGIENSFAWRFFGALAGVGAVLFMYLLARKLFASEVAGLAGAFLLTVEGLAFAQSRIATPDTFVLFFMLGTVYFLVSERFLFSGVFFGAAVACKWVAALTAVPIALFLVWLLLTRLREARSDDQVKWFEITLPAGLTVLFMGVLLVLFGFLNRHPDEAPGFFDGLGLMDWAGWLLLVAGALTTVASFGGLIAQYSSERALVFSPGGRLALEMALVLGVFFILVPGFIYFMTYLPFLLNPPAVAAMGDRGFLGLEQVVRQNRLAWDFHQNLTQPHPYSSTWDQWPLNARPVYFHLTEGTNAKIYNVGNSVIFWAGLPAMAFALWQALRHVAARIETNGTLSLWGRLPVREAALLFVVLSYLGFWLPWAIQQETGGRVLFLYHYLPAVAFLILALSYSVHWLWDRPDRPPGAVIEPGVIEESTRNVVLGVTLASIGIALIALNSVVSGQDLADGVFVLAIVVGMLLAAWGVARGPASYGRAASAVFLAAAAVTFAYFYPHLASVDVPNWLERTYYWEWLPDWLGFNWH